MVRLVRPLMLSTAVAVTAVTGVHTAAFAQQNEPARVAPEQGTPSAPSQAAADPPAPAAAPAPPPAPSPPPQPTGVYPPAPPGGQPPSGYGAAPSGYGPPPSGYPTIPPSGVHRPVSFSLSVGPGWLGFRDADRRWDYDLGVSYGLRIGLGLANNLSLSLDFQGTGATKQGFYFRQEAYLLGLQYFVGQVFYLRGGVGLGNITHSDGLYLYGVGGPGLAISGAAGIELVQAPSSSLAIEGSVTGVSYDHSQWAMSAVNLVFSFF